MRNVANAVPSEQTTGGSQSQLGYFTDPAIDDATRTAGMTWSGWSPLTGGSSPAARQVASSRQRHPTEPARATTFDQHDTSLQRHATRSGDPGVREEFGLGQVWFSNSIQARSCTLMARLLL